MKHLPYTKGLFIALLLLMPIGMQAYDLKVDGIYYNAVGDEITLEVTYGDEKYSGDIVIPESVTYNKRAYKVTAIGNKAFYDCTNLTSVKFPNATKIGDYAFYNCASLTSVDFPNATTIGGHAFEDCTSLTSVDFPNATEIGDYAFSDCASLTSVDFPNATETGYSAFLRCTSLTSVDFPNATTIGGHAFEDCASLTNVNIPNATKIGDYAFHDCASLSKYEIPKGVINIGGTSVFEGCTNLAELIFADGNKELTIGPVDRQYYKSYHTFNLPPSLKTIYIGRILKATYYPNSTDSTFIVFSGENLSNATIGPKTKSLPIQIFDECNNLANINILDGDETLFFINRESDDYKDTFGKADINLYIGRPFTFFKHYSWSDWYLESLLQIKCDTLSFGRSLTQINAYHEGDNLKDIYCMSAIPPTLMQGKETFDNGTYVKAILHVPAGSLANYQTADYWKLFFIQEEDFPNNVPLVEDKTQPCIKMENGNVIVENARDMITVYDLSGTVVKHLQAQNGRVEMSLPKHRVYIVKVGNKTEKVVL